MAIERKGYSGKIQEDDRRRRIGGRHTGRRADSERYSSRTSEIRSGKQYTGKRNATYETDRIQPEERTERKEYQLFEYDSGNQKSFRPDTAQRNEASDKENFILTGRNPIREALKNNRDLEKLLVQKGELSGSAREIVQKAKERKVLVQVVEKSRLDEIAPHHQGLIAFASAYHYSTVEEMLRYAKEQGEDPFLILLDGITDPHNLGAILRTAECSGAHGVIVPLHHSAGLSPSAIKASAGAVEYVKVARVTNLSRTLDELKKANIWTYAVTMTGQDYRKADFRGGVALVIGSEEDGISRLVLEKCDGSVSLPMTGKIESLNASVAAGIIMYQVLSCRQKA